MMYLDDFMNWDHDNSPENIIGVLDWVHSKQATALYVSDRLFLNHDRAKAVHIYYGVSF